MPSTRTDSGSRHLMLAFQDTATIGNPSNPFVLHGYVQYRGEPSLLRATNAEPSPVTTLFNMFSSLTTNRLSGDLGQARFGAGFSSLLLKQQYVSAGGQLSKLVGAHDVKFGVYVLSRVGGPTPADNLVRIRNFYNGLFVQDDWKIAKGLTLNAGLRWDYDSRFPNGGNYSPRLGVAWSPTQKTVVTASWGMFYD
ncbi:MAG TPA: TonB-dependent receptor, partial [Pyrinomonadaceae bacterium]|nr:TonB-dependent receptor [Pyrinomonadaceae bacterium]